MSGSNIYGKRMINYAANLTLMFQEWSFLDRFEAAREAGFEAVEFSFPADIPANQVRAQLERTGLCQVLATARLQPGSKGTAAVHGQQSRFREDFRIGLEYAVEAKSPLLHVLAGTVVRSDLAASCGQFISNMEWAIQHAATENVRVVIEAINQNSVPNYFITSLSAAFDWSARLPGLGVILDLYHAAMEGLEPVDCIGRYAEQCDHIQIAGYPGRHEPDRGTLDLGEILATIENSHYRGWVGCEYQPAGPTVDGLRWLSSIIS